MNFRALSNSDAYFSQAENVAKGIAALSKREDVQKRAELQDRLTKLGNRRRELRAELEQVNAEIKVLVLELVEAKFNKKTRLASMSGMSRQWIDALLKESEATKS